MRYKNRRLGLLTLLHSLEVDGRQSGLLQYCSVLVTMPASATLVGNAACGF